MPPGCILAELILAKTLLKGTSEMEQARAAPLNATMTALADGRVHAVARTTPTLTCVDKSTVFLFSASSQLTLIFRTCGAPTPDVWPGFDKLPDAANFVRNNPAFRNRLKEVFARQSTVTQDLIGKMLALDPAKRRGQRRCTNACVFCVCGALSWCLGLCASSKRANQSAKI